MIVIADKPGRLGNRLTVLAHLIAFAAEHNLSVANPALDEYADLVPFYRGDPFCRFPEVRSRLPAGQRARRLAFQLARSGAALSLWHRLPGARITRLDWQERQSLSDPAFIETARSARLLFLQGWLFRDQELLLTHQDTVRRVLTPRPAVLERARTLVEKIRSAGPIVGFHVRRDDYVRHLGGRYFFDRRSYETLFNRAVELFGDDAAFVVCSDEPSASSWFRRTEKGPGDEAGDLFTLAACDYIIGPPSSFSMWASFYGRVPLYVVVDPTAAFRIEDFQIAPSAGPSDVRDLY